MNYSEMSDFEINSRVARAMKFEGMMFFDVDESICNGPVWNVASGLTDEGIRISRGNAFHPCNSWADSGPIIKEYLICLSPGGHDNSGMVLWTAFCKLKGAKTTNPLKSAMIAFLMMHEAQNE